MLLTFTRGVPHASLEKEANPQTLDLDRAQGAEGAGWPIVAIGDRAPASPNGTRRALEGHAKAHLSGDEVAKTGTGRHGLEPTA